MSAPSVSVTVSARTVAHTLRFYVECLSSVSFKSFLRSIQQRQFPTVKAFADALEMNPTQISRGQPFDVRRCIKLAKLTGISLDVILRAAGKADIADGLAAVLPTTPAAVQLATDEFALLEAYRAMTPTLQRDILSVAQAVTDATVRAKRARKRTRLKNNQT